MDTSKANPVEKNGKRLGKLTRQPQKYETTLLGRQRAGSRLTYLRRGESKASQLKRHGKHIGKPTRNPRNEANNAKITLGPRAIFFATRLSKTKNQQFKITLRLKANFFSNKARKHKEPRVTQKGWKAPDAQRAQKRGKQSKPFGNWAI